ncbi:MAG: NAD-dependent epimerase/dehydratase family protein [Planctomycetota bacterium]|jgi:2'-hydroxyisoflavone reductase
MSITRRRFVSGSAGFGAAALMGALWARGASAQDAALGAARSPDAGATDPLRLLILGGTAFLGPHTVEAALERGHTLTLFNRGKTNPHLFPDLEKLVGDRDPEKGEGLSALEGREWDAVIDTSGYVPRIVKASATLLAPSVQQYLFISSISVFSDNSTPGMKEDGPLATMEDEADENVMANYGALKALCEAAAEAALPGRATTVRPGLIIGPGDPTDRYTYWPARLALGGEVLAPGDGSDPVQYVDARDLAAWLVHLVEQRAMGVYNATGPASELSMRAMLTACRAGCTAAATEDAPNGAADAKLTWVSTDFLAEQEVAPWGDMPVWLPGTGETAGFSRVDCGKAIAAGLRFRPAIGTAHDTLVWHLTRPEERRSSPRAGISPEREAKVLAAWHEREG